jgi:hypothetical protein
MSGVRLYIRHASVVLDTIIVKYWRKLHDCTVLKVRFKTHSYRPDEDEIEAVLTD